MISLRDGDSYKTSKFGDFCPYWTKDENGHVYISESFDEIITKIPPEKRYIDPVAVASLLQFNYIHGNRTLVKGINKIPWRASLLSNGTITREPPIPHNDIYASPFEIASNLRRLLLNELANYIENYSNVYLLLSGGYDSRVTAGLLKILQDKLPSFNVTSITWGIEKSRDVNYAKQISRLYDWDCIHIPLNEKILYDAIFESVRYCGSEVAGVSLHGEDQLKNLTKDDIVLASSFGDSIGRGEFSGRHLDQIKFPNFKNYRGCMLYEVHKNCIPHLNQDRETAFELSENESYSALCELDLQENYMRRMIVQAMGYIRQWTNLEQMFTSDEVVSYIWSLHPRCRNNSVYAELFKQIDMRLYSMPWARTAVSFDGNVDNNSKLTKNHHEYNIWLKESCSKTLYDRIFSGGLCELNIFDMDNVEKAWKKWQKNQMDDFQFTLTIAQLEILRDKYNLNTDENYNKNPPHSRISQGLESAHISVEWGLRDSNLMKYLWHKIVR
jgi:asparagine synthase (glutamine-hydrolysing)